MLVKYVVSMLAASAPCLWVGGWPKRGSLPNACCAYLHILSPPLSFFILLMRPSYQCHRRRRTDFDNQKYTNVRYGKVPVILMKNIKFGLENEFGLLMIFVIDGEKKATQQHMHAKDVWKRVHILCSVLCTICNIF